MLTLVILLFILWAIFGSFGWVIVERWRDWFSRWSRGEVFWWRSYCPGCDWKLLVWRQLIPLVGRLMQWWKCFRCKSQIPVWYCRIELLMGLVFAATGAWIIWWLWIWSFYDLVALEPMVWVQLWVWCLINRALVLIILADLYYYELNVYLWVILLVLACINLWVTYWWVVENYLPVVYWTIVLTGLFVAIYKGAKWYATKKMGTEAEWFWEWDVMMAFAMGLLLPPVFAAMNSVDRIVWVQWLFSYLVFSSALWIIYRAVRKTITGNDDWFLPFLPSMIVAYWLMLLWSDLLNMVFIGL